MRRWQQPRALAATGAKYLILGALAFLFVAPLVFMVSSSFKSDRQIFDDLRSFVGVFLPGGLTTNYETVLTRVPFLQYLGNSTVIVVATVIPGLFINSLAAFALARLRWPGRKILLGFIVWVIIAPFEAIYIPLFLMINELPWVDGTTSWVDTLQGQIIPFVADAFSIFLFYQTFLTLPRELDEAVVVDGGGAWTVYRHIAVPLSGPVFATAAIFHGLGMYSAYLWPQMITRSEETRPLTIGILSFFGAGVPKWGAILAYSTLALAPILILFLLFQRWFVESMANTGIKG